MWQSFLRPRGETEQQQPLLQLICFNTFTVSQLETAGKSWPQWGKCYFQLQSFFHVNRTFCYWKSRDDDQSEDLFRVRRTDVEVLRTNILWNFQMQAVDCWFSDSVILRLQISFRVYPCIMQAYCVRRQFSWFKERLKKKGKAHHRPGRENPEQE